ncbi:MAG: hypothetical protein KVP17_002195 [Porospora cf. gigantea B]|uniref:uncharacterized protein n=1 Tax=Porospora cf. gigantea B TaxID=2853592 RepID=UPI003571D146|nr:MAG: hypothetical protein KVP17_002195 [Porospora cf. gigantea B]
MDPPIRVPLSAVDPDPVSLLIGNWTQVDAVGALSTSVQIGSIPRHLSAEEEEMDVPDEISARRFRRRRDLFSRFDDGILMDSDAWQEVTPEAVAAHAAERLIRIGGQSATPTVVDCCSGVGGNLIQLAMAGLKTTGVEMCPRRLQHSRHNAAIYGVEDRINFILADVITWAADVKVDIAQEAASLTPAEHLFPPYVGNRLKGRRFDFAFVSPPWGGEAYKNYDCWKMECEVLDIFRAIKDIAEHVVCFLPRSTIASELVMLARSVFRCEIIEIEKLYSFHPDLIRFVHVYFYNVKGRERLVESSEATPLKALRNRFDMPFLRGVSLKRAPQHSNICIPEHMAKRVNRTTRLKEKVDNPKWMTSDGEGMKDACFAETSASPQAAFSQLSLSEKHTELMRLLTGTLCCHLQENFNHQKPQIYYLLQTLGLHHLLAAVAKSEAVFLSGNGRDTQGALRTRGGVFFQTIKSDYTPLYKELNANKKRLIVKTNKPVFGEMTTQMDERWTFKARSLTPSKQEALDCQDKQTDQG